MSVDTAAPPARRLTWPVPVLGLVALAGFWLGGIPGAVALYAALGVFPGMALATALGGRSSRERRWLLGLAIAPLVSAAAGWMLLAAGVALPLAARIIAAAGFAAAVALPPLLNPFIRVHGDGWVHAGMVWEVALRGVTPQDPRFAGLPINYVWFYNLFVALFTGLPGPGGQDPFVFMAILNVVTVALITRFAYSLGVEVWGDRDAGAGTALLVTLGFNAGAWLLWPLRLLTALTGEVRGAAAIRGILHNTHLLDDRVFFILGAPFAHEVSFLDKFLLGSPLAYAWLLTLLLLDTMLGWVREARPERLAWAALASAGLLLFHFVPGLSVVPVTLGALALTGLLRSRWPWLPGRGRLAVFAVATLLGALVVAPYTLSIMRGWGQTGVREEPFHVGGQMLWTLVTSCGVAAAFAWRPLRRVFPERRAAGAVLVSYLAGMTLFALVVHLTENNEHKFAFQVFVPLAVLGGSAFLPTVRGWFRRWGTARAVALLVALFASHLLMLNGYLADPRGRTAPELDRAPAEEHLYAWMRDSTDTRAVFVDAHFRDLIMVRGRRRLYYGSTFGPEHAGFPMAQVVERRAVMADLYGPGDRLEGDARALAACGPQAFVVFRPEDERDDASGEAPWRKLERHPAWFRRAYLRDGVRVYEVAKPAE